MPARRRDAHQPCDHRSGMPQDEWRTAGGGVLAAGYARRWGVWVVDLFHSETSGLISSFHVIPDQGIYRRTSLHVSNQSGEPCNPPARITQTRRLSETPWPRCQSAFGVCPSPRSGHESAQADCRRDPAEDGGARLLDVTQRAPSRTQATAQRHRASASRAYRTAIATEPAPVARGGCGATTSHRQSVTFAPARSRLSPLRSNTIASSKYGTSARY